MIQKTEWRQILQQRRKAISPQRRKEAAEAAFEQLKTKGRTLSFSPIGSEIDLRPLNEYLKKEGRLFLVPYEADLTFEPPFQEIDCILVPGLGFDREFYRLGYGQGWYDRFLAKTISIHTIGIGFKEQFCAELLPRDSWDIPLKEIILT